MNKLRYPRLDQLPTPENGAASGLRPAALGAVGGMLAGFLFAVSRILVQAVITHMTVASYRAGRVDNTSSFIAHPVVLAFFTLLGSSLGVLYGAGRARLRTPSVPTALGFAALLVLVLVPLLTSLQGYFSAPVDVTAPVTAPGGLVKTFDFAQDAAPPRLLGSILAALVFLQGLAIPLFARLAGRLMPRLPVTAYAVILPYQCSRFWVYS